MHGNSVMMDSDPMYSLTPNLLKCIFNATESAVVNDDEFHLLWLQSREFREEIIQRIEKCDELTDEPKVRL